MSNGSAFDYGFGAKRHWRRWIWNRISERIPNKRDAICVYLPSSEDNDRPIAIAKGFRDWNLIGVERESDALRSARAKGSLVIQSDFFDAVEVLANKRDVSVVFGDFCSGLNGQFTADLAHWFCNPRLRNAIFAFNFMRGRDPKSNEVRQKFSSSITTDAMRKHRGLIAIADATRYLATCHEDTEFGLNAWRAYMKEADGDVYSYKSESGQMFDSVVATNPLRRINYGSPDACKAMEAAYQTYYARLRRTKPSMDKAMSHAAAVMAHRTMRLQAA